MTICGLKDTCGICFVPTSGPGTWTLIAVSTLNDPWNVCASLEGTSE